MREHLTDSVDKAVCTEESGAARLEAVLVALVERKARALHAEHSRTHPLLLLLRHLPDEEASMIGSPGEELPSHWCEHEIARHKRRKLRLQTRSKEKGPEQLEVERRRKRRRRRSPRDHSRKPRKHRTLLVSAIDEQAKVIHVLDPDELPRRARYTIMVTACLLLFLCLLLVGVTLRMAPLIDDMENGTKDKDDENQMAAATILSPPQAMPPSPTAPTDEFVPAIQHANREPSPDLDPELLDALGDTSDDVPVYGPNIHSKLAQRWLPILKKGLQLDAKEKLLKEYAVPENCKLLKAPTLNAEIAAAVADFAKGRDKKMQIKQDQLGLGITAMNKAMTLLLTGDDKVQTLKILSDACRILTDLHYVETQARTKLITPGLDKSILTVLQDHDRDETLFGNSLSEKIKASRAIEKQGLQIKKPAVSKAPTSSVPPTSARPRQLGNWPGPPRHHQMSRGGRVTYRHQYRRPPARAPSTAPPAQADRPSTAASTNRRAPIQH